MTLSDIRCPMCGRLLSGRKESPEKYTEPCRHCQLPVALESAELKTEVKNA
jgi:hypothetical protein